MGRRNRRYVNAKFVLPEDLYLQAKEHLEGRLVWFPKDDDVDREARNEYVRQLREEGLTVAEIADRLRLSMRHVWRILEKSRAASLPAEEKTEWKQ